MKKSYLPALGLLGGLVLLGCPSPSSPPSTEGKGALSISFSDQVSGRSLGPPLSMHPESYSIAATGPGGATFTRTLSAADAAAGLRVEELVFGQWELEGSAYNADSVPTRIGGGRALATVRTGETTEVPLALTPLPGPGSFHLRVVWTGPVEEGRISGSLRPETGADPVATFDIPASGSAYTTTNLEAGYYRLSLKLFDGKQNLIAGAEESLRIVSGQLSSGTITFSDVSGPGGSLSMTVAVDLKNPILVSLGPDPVNHLELWATQEGAVGTPSFTWYVNGDSRLPPGSLATGAHLRLPSDLAQGFYRIDLLVTAREGLQAGSGSFVFNNLVARTVGVADLADAAGFPDAGIGYDFDMDPPRSLAGGAPGFGPSAFASEVTGRGTRVYTALRIAPQSLLRLSTLKVEDILSLSFWSRQELSGTRTWQLKLYTLDPASTPAGWYTTRINATLAYPADTDWCLQSTSPEADPAILLRFDKITPFGEADQKPGIPLSLEELKTGLSTTGTNNAPLTVLPHGGEPILWIDIIAGDSGGTAIQSSLDGLTLVTTKGEIILDLGD